MAIRLVCIVSVRRQVLFCNMTEKQIREYRGVLSSRELGQVLAGGGSAFRAITMLRKICNHADLLMVDSPCKPEDYGMNLCLLFCAAPSPGCSSRVSDTNSEKPKKMPSSF